MASKMCIVCGGDLPCKYKHSQEDPTRRSLRLEREAKAPPVQRDSVPKPVPQHNPKEKDDGDETG